MPLRVFCRYGGPTLSRIRIKDAIESKRMTRGSFQQIQFLQSECQGMLDRVVVECAMNLNFICHSGTTRIYRPSVNSCWRAIFY
jgi:hypothetical protein